MTREIAAEFVPIEEIKEWGDNPRVNDHVVDDVALSIKRFGFASPIIARKETGEIIAGHTRYKAARKLGLKEVPVRFVDLDPVDSRLLAIADNKIGEKATWDQDALRDVLLSLASEGADFEGIGFDESDLQHFLESIDGDLSELSDTEETTEEIEPPIPEDVPAITKPGEVIQLGNQVLHCGDCLDVMRDIPENSIDSICTDPPYGIGFMDSKWDVSVPGDEFAVEAFRVLKPGGHLIAFAATRTIHRLTVALENAGFEVRDQISWAQWQGFPKSHNVAIAIDKHLGAMLHRGTAHYGYAPGKDFEPNLVAPKEMDEHQAITPEAKKWQGWGTALKPACEPCIIVRKPLEGTIAENVLKWNTGGLNIDATRMPYGDPCWPGSDSKPPPQINNRSQNRVYGDFYGSAQARDQEWTGSDLGRWPANLFHCAKPSIAEKEDGCEEMLTAPTDVTGRKPGSKGQKHARASMTGDRPRGNFHPTIKPIKLMRWLARLITPHNGTCLEPFCGSGTTLLACELEGFNSISIEMEPKYCDIIRARFSAMSKNGVPLDDDQPITPGEDNASKEDS